MSQARLETSCLPKSERRNETPYWGEHTARYVFAARYLAGRRVLDIACGTGYGLSFLGERACFIVGADLSFSAVQTAQLEITNEDTVALVADGCCLPFADRSFDGITSFETLEHLERRSQFLGELRRVISPQGVCVISTPNANYTLPVNGKPRNPFHVFEYKPEELSVELTKYFQCVRIFGQHLSSRIVLSPFWEDQQRLTRTPKNMLNLLVWRILNKLPFAMRDMVSHALWGHFLYPGEEDYVFDPVAIQNARVLVAVCSPSSQEVL